jgi:hypothetical protein
MRAVARCEECSSSSRGNEIRSDLSSLRPHLGPIALFGALAIAWTWPLVLHLHDAVPGDPADNYSFLWNLWWMRHVLATPGLAYFDTTYLFHPFGTTIVDHPNTALPALVAATLLKPASIVTVQNLLPLAYVFANMAAMCALVWDIAPQRRAAVLGPSCSACCRFSPSICWDASIS